MTIYFVDMQQIIRNLQHNLNTLGSDLNRLKKS